MYSIRWIQDGINDDGPIVDTVNIQVVAATKILWNRITAVTSVDSSIANTYSWTW